MAQTPCESSLRPDWLGVSFKSASPRHQQQLLDFLQSIPESIAPDLHWKQGSGSKHFERVFTHDLGLRIEFTPISPSPTSGSTLINCSGLYFSVSSVYEQMKLFEQLHQYKGRYHYTRLDAQVTTLNPEQSAEQIVDDVVAGQLWIKGYKGFKPDGVRDINGEPTGGLSACFGSPQSDRKATSYNKGAQQTWDTPARRDEVRLRGEWAERHTADIATAIAGASSENEAIDAYVSGTRTAIVQHMQYLDITGQPKPRPKNWARNAKTPKWWTDTIEQQITPVTLNRKPESGIEVRFGHMKTQWARIFAEYVTHRCATGMSDSFHQSIIDTGLQLFQYAKEDDVDQMLLDLPEADRAFFKAAWEGSVAVAATHSEHVL